MRAIEHIGDRGVQQRLRADEPAPADGGAPLQEGHPGVAAPRPLHGVAEVEDAGDDELRRHDWAGFARGYNGRNYKINQYDVKIAAAYKRFRAENIDCSEVNNDHIILEVPPVSAAVSPELSATATTPEVNPTASQPETATKTETPPNVAPNNTQTINAPAKEGSTQTAVTTTVLGITVPAGIGIIFKAVTDLIAQGFIDAKQIGDFVMNLVQNNLKYVLILVGLIIVGLMLKKVFKQVTFFLQMWFAASKDKNNVEIIKQ